MTASAPTRIDFGGGWTDVPPYPERDGGFVCNVAIARLAHVELREGDGELPHVRDPLADSALRLGGLAGVAARITSGYPVGAGLGGSSAAGVALQAAMATWRGEVVGADELVRRSRAVEVNGLGIAGGWQDHYAAAFGGALGLEFGATTRVHRIAMHHDTVAELERRCLLIYTGETRISSENITAVLDAYAARDPRVLAALARMATLARDMAAALASGDLDTLGALVQEHWEHQRSLHPAITTPRIDDIAERARAAGALGWKALGASGGGCVVVVTPGDPAAVRAALAGCGELLPFTIAREGVRTAEVHA